MNGFASLENYFESYVVCYPNRSADGEGASRRIVQFLPSSKYFAETVEISENDTFKVEVPRRIASDGGGDDEQVSQPVITVVSQASPLYFANPVCLQGGWTVLMFIAKSQSKARN